MQVLSVLQLTECTLQHCFCTQISLLPCVCFFFFQPVHRRTQFSCAIHSQTSVKGHLDRTGLESVVFAETRTVHTVILMSCRTRKFDTYSCGRVSMSCTEDVGRRRCPTHNYNDHPGIVGWKALLLRPVPGVALACDTFGCEVVSSCAGCKQDGTDRGNRAGGYDLD